MLSERSTKMLKHVNMFDLDQILCNKNILIDNFCSLVLSKKSLDLYSELFQKSKQLNLALNSANLRFQVQSSPGLAA